MKHFIGLFLILSSCATQKNVNNSGYFKSAEDYEVVVEKNTDKIRRYSGFYNTLDIEATVLSPTISHAQVAKQAELFLWDSNRMSDEKARTESRLSRETEVFMSFFTPDRKNNDLIKTNSMWKIFLDVEGRRYEGKINKIKLQLTEIQALYPYHNRFYTPYSVTFPVSMKSIEGKTLKMTITGSLASGTLEFKP
jgi:hypothetical protein